MACGFVKLQCLKTYRIRDREYIYTYIYIYIDIWRIHNSTHQCGACSCSPQQNDQQCKVSPCIHRANSESAAYWTSSSSWQLVQHWTTIRRSTYHIELLPAKLRKTHELNVWSAAVLVRVDPHLHWKTTVTALRSLLVNENHLADQLESKYCAPVQRVREEPSSQTKMEEGEGIVITTFCNFGSSLEFSILYKSNVKVSQISWLSLFTSIDLPWKINGCK